VTGITHTSQKTVYKAQISGHRQSNNIARCGKRKVVACAIRLQNLQSPVSEAKSLFNKSKSLKFSYTWETTMTEWDNSN
jgi:hypothetical protein